MSLVEITKSSELYLTVKAEKAIQRELMDKFSFFAPGFKHMPLYKSGQWDGRIKLYNPKTSTLPFGLIVELIRFCKKNRYEFSIAKDIRTLNLSQELDSFIDNISTICTKSPTGKYTYQLDILKSVVGLNKALVLSSTGSGKSFIIYLLVRFLLDNIEGPILITVPTVGLVTQLRKDFISYVADGFDIDAVMDFKNGPGAKKSLKRVLCTTWQSIYRQPEEWYLRFNDSGAYICDEAHLADAKSITGIINKVENTIFRVGFTGTLDGTKSNEMFLRGMFGPIVKFADTKQLIKNDVLSKITIDVRLMEYTNEEKRVFHKTIKSYQDEINWIVGNPKRNSLILDCAMDGEKNALVLFTLVDKHGIVLYNMAKEINDGKVVFFISGDTPPEERETIREYTEKNNNVVIFASYPTMSTGTNITNLHRIVFAHPHKGRVRNLQSIGRILRPHETKSKAIAIDIGDDMTYRNKQNLSLRHLLQRLKIYSAEGFPYTITRV